MFVWPDGTYGYASNTRGALLPLTRIPPLVLSLRPPAALCCQVEPEGLALITGMKLAATLVQDIPFASPRLRPNRARLILRQQKLQHTICCRCLPSRPGAKEQIPLCVCAGESFSPVFSALLPSLWFPFGSHSDTFTFQENGAHWHRSKLQT